MEFDLTKRHCYYFNETTKIPHGSFNEKALSDYIVEFAKNNGLRYVQDESYNVVVYKDASKGYEDKEPLILQAHIDMVCEKNKDSSHNFETDPLDLYVEDGLLKARGTTLGADDCAGAAYMLAILEDKTLAHPALECIFTTMEEVGLIGATRLDKNVFTAKRMISLDGGGETATMLTSAGGCRCDIIRNIEWVENNEPTYSLAIRGLAGGHSGGEIHKEKGNANQLAIRVLKEAMIAGNDATLVDFNGGLKENAIPRESDIIFTSSSSLEDLTKAILASETAIKEELEFSDSGFTVEFNKVDTASKKMSKESSDDIIDYVYLMPNGFRHKSMAIEGLTITSLNIGVVETKEDHIVLHVSLRSAIDSGMDNLIGILSTLARRLGFRVETGARYPGWNYSTVSPMRDTFSKVVKDIYDQELVLIAAHGGCECGVFKGFEPEMDIISVGPKCAFIHTPDEQLDLASFDRTYTLLCSIMAAL